MHFLRFFPAVFDLIRKNINFKHTPRGGPLPWIASPIDETKDGPQLRRQSDATPIELFFDLFFVANLSTFTATHEINNVNGMFLLYLLQCLELI
jgi:hypothetical protein